MKRYIMAAAVGAAAIAGTVHAQTAVPLRVGLAAHADPVLRTGTPVALRMSEQLTTKGKNLRVGQRFRLEVSEPVLVDGMTVIPAGSPAMGEVTSVRNKGMWGKSGAINARLVSVTVAGRAIRLSGSLDDKGTTGTAGVVGAIAFVPIAGFLMTGTSATIPLGTPIFGFIDEDVPLQTAPSVSASTLPPVEQPRPSRTEVRPAADAEVVPGHGASRTRVVLQGVEY